MLRIHPVILDVIRLLGPSVAGIERRDSDLGRQLRRALASVALNVSEGQYSQGRNRRARYFNALGSAREVLSCLEVAEALGYLPAVDEGARAKLDHVLATLWRLTH